MTNKTILEQLQDMMQQLRHESHGCAWCKRQTLDSLTQYTIEEAYELTEAVNENNIPAIKEELADLLLQVLFYAQIGEEQDLFSLDELMQKLSQKIKRRNPHVFDIKKPLTLKEIAAQWEQIKHDEQQQKPHKPDSLLNDVPRSLPALSRAHKLQQHAHRVGFDWDALPPIFDKLQEEIMVLNQAITNKLGHNKISEEMGNVLFTCSNIARHLGLDPETALQQTNNKFDRRFRWMEQHTNHKALSDLSLDEMEELWQKAKDHV
ncbi:MAG: nucleoside triphosphate pyrophosphohydrolase [Gammaproteobacteria bacterium RIFCSPHIGHO2_02_FULL_42_13]|nr:MAG: nucleoside triphosphate pyrophosphohydrolase [Gammaproteobacteria bacterium RIFCSPHIGHO2_02_FULL_42_13]OGT69703.1 MAG: nucleoside triphosphate pyrophosphohydrolase [Gammaproteobacteria bacterium RIFCSPLOWO2_02_FULL_42_9]